MFEQNILQGPGTGTFTTHTFEIIFMLLVAFLLGLWFGWVLWSKYRQEAERLRTENASLDATATTLRQENEDLKKKLAAFESERANLEGQVQNLNWDVEKLRNQLTVQESDLAKVLERNRQLESELGLSLDTEGAESGSTPVSTEPMPSEPLEEDLPDLEAVMSEAADESAKLENPASDIPGAPIIDPTPGLRPLDELEPDRTVVLPLTPETIVPMPETPADDTTASKSASEAPEETLVAAFTTGPRDDLKIVEGIGPKIEELLFKAGVTTYGQLAATSVQQLQDILDNAGSRFAMHDPGTWSAQALLAANGEWDNLKAYQDFLNAGKRPDK